MVASVAGVYWQLQKCSYVLSPSMVKISIGCLSCWKRYRAGHWTGCLVGYWVGVTVLSPCALGVWDTLMPGYQDVGDVDVRM